MKKGLVLLAVGALAVSAWSQSSGVFYAAGRSIADQNIKLSGWGSGTIVEADEMAYQGVNSLRVTTRNFFQGGIMTLGNPIDLNSSFPVKSNLLRLTFRVVDSNTKLGGGDGSGAGKGPADGGAGGVGQMGGASGPISGGTRGGPGQAGGAADGGVGAAPSGASATSDATLKNVRLIFTTTDGLRSEVYVPIATGKSSSDWRSAAVPLQAITGFERTNKTIQSVAISGDATTTFYVGDMRVINDTTPITGDANVRDLNLALGDEVDLYAVGAGGASVLRYTWDFDDKDGIQVDAEGQAVRRKFRKPGKFVITVTISDKYGLKNPYTTKINVTVNP